jgi:hypothetical protein
MNRIWIVVTLCVVILAACAPSTAAVNTAIAQTQAANPTVTNTTQPTKTNTPLPAATPTFTASPSPTPDLRIIKIEPKGFLLAKDEIAPGGKFFLPGPGWISPSHNEEVVAVRTVEEGRKYLAETGRIDGWYVTYKRGNNGVNMPEEVSNSVIEFGSAQGAQILLNKYLPSDLLKDGYAEIENPPSIGDATKIFMKREIQSGGDTRVIFIMAFTYLNYYDEIDLWGWESDISQDFARVLSELQLGKFKSAPLSVP